MPKQAEAGAPALSEADKRLRALFKVQLALFGPARFENSEFQGREWIGVVAEVEGLAPESIGRFEASTTLGRTVAGATVPAAVLFTAGGRDGLGPIARTLPNSFGKSGDIVVGKERFGTWPVGNFGRSVREAKTGAAGTGRTHVPVGAANVNAEDYLVAIPVILEAGGGVEYDFLVGKKVHLGFLFPRGAQELSHVRLLGHDLVLDPAQQGAVLIAVTNRAPADAIPAPVLPKDGSTPLVEVARIVTPIPNPLNLGGGVREHFTPQRAVFAPDGEEIAGVGSARACWRPGGGLVWGTDEPAETVRYSADGAKVFLAANGHLSVYDRKGKKLSTCQLGQPAPPITKLLNPGVVWKGVDVRDPVIVSPDGKVAYAPTADATEKAAGKLTFANFGIRGYETAKGKEVRRFPIKHSAWVTCLALSSDGKRLLTGSEDTTVRLWDTATMKELKVIKAHTARIVAVGWSQDGTRMLTAAHDYDLDLLKKLQNAKQPTDAAQKDGTVRVWDTASGDEVFQLKPKFGQQGAVLSPDGRLLALGRSIWEVGDEKPRYSVPAEDQGSIDIIAFSADGRSVLASARGQWRGPGQPNAALMRYRIP
jgi:WD40 repeat protein